jgi:predicted RNA polymerase sigma factor
MRDRSDHPGGYRDGLAPESTRLIAGLVRIVRAVGLAEDLAHDALVAALTQSPRTGVPDTPGAWLMTTPCAGQGITSGDWTAEISSTPLSFTGKEDDVLRLMFVCCHPVLTRRRSTP